MVLFLAIVPLLYTFDSATSLVWTILLPLLPISFLLLGFSRWRDVCPLATISKITQNINIVPKRKVPIWFEKNFWFFQYFLLFISLSFRLTTLNYDYHYLAMFVILVILSALLINLIFTGKSWCNFFCPVGTVEKIYTLSNAKNFTHNSACSTCTACKKNCPDIDLESNYWKEGASWQKNFVFYSFPGMIFGFYIYFYLLSGNWEYYFLGSWTKDYLGIFSSGFYFAPAIPLIVAAPLTLAVFSLISFYFFYVIEHYLWKKRVYPNASYETLTHRIKTVSSFIAFNIFYVFAGAPSYSHYPILYALFYFFAVFLSSVIMYKEIFREEAFFIQERFALKIIKRWKSTKVIPSNLKEIYYTYINENRSKEERLKTYKSSITDLMKEGILTQDSIKILEKLREQIGISTLDHNNIMRLIKFKNEALFDNTIEKSREKEYQENSYKEFIEGVLNEHMEIEQEYLRSLQKQFCISDDVHTKIIDSILKNNDTINQDIMKYLENIHKLIRLQNSIYEDQTREVNFLRYSIKYEFTYASKELFNLLFTIYNKEKKTLKILLSMSKGKQIPDDFIMDKNTLKFMHESITEKMLLIYEDIFIHNKKVSVNNNSAIIAQLLSHDSMQIAVAALLNTKNYTQMFLSDNVIDRFCNSNDEDILQLLYKLKYKTDTITTYERMMYLNFIPIFKNLKFTDLYSLGESTKLITLNTDEYIIKQGGVGSTLYILIKGAAVVEVDGVETATLGRRDYFGEIALLGDTKRTASVKVTEPTTILSISKKQFKLFLDTNPMVATKVMKEIIKKLI